VIALRWFFLVIYGFFIQGKLGGIVVQRIYKLILAVVCVLTLNASPAFADKTQAQMEAQQQAYFDEAQQLCDPDPSEECSSLGSRYQTLGIQYQKGYGRPVDKTKARGFYAKACDEGYLLACDFLATMLYSGEGGPIDKIQARSLFTKGCDRNDAKGCLFLGVMFAKGEGGHVDIASAKNYFTKACTLGVKAACTVKL
jgi:uncharacterized protein